MHGADPFEKDSDNEMPIEIIVSTLKFDILYLKHEKELCEKKSDVKNDISRSPKDYCLDGVDNSKSKIKRLKQLISYYNSIPNFRKTVVSIKEKEKRDKEERDKKKKRETELALEQQRKENLQNNLIHARNRYNNAKKSGPYSSGCQECLRNNNTSRQLASMWGKWEEIPKFGMK